MLLERGANLLTPPIKKLMENEIKKNGLTKSDWLGILGVILGVIGLGSSYYFYKLSVKERMPILLEETFRPLLVGADSIKNSPIRVVNKEGDLISKDLSSLRFYFFNDGEESIKHSNIMKAIQLELASDDVQIIDAKLLVSSRPEIVKPKIAVSQLSPRNVDIDFDILEKDDGFAVEVLFSGSNKTPLIVHGTIEGVKHIETNTNTEVTFFQLYKSLTWKIVISLVFSAVMLYPLFFPLKLFQKIRTSRRLIIIVFVIIFITIAALTVVLNNKKSRDRFEQNVREKMLDNVPINIMSEPVSVTHKD